MGRGPGGRKPELAVTSTAIADVASEGPASSAIEELAAADEAVAESNTESQLPASTSEYRVVGRVNEQGDAEIFASVEAAASAAAEAQVPPAGNPAGCTLTAFDPFRVGGSVSGSVSQSAPLLSASTSTAACSIIGAYRTGPPRTETLRARLPRPRSPTCLGLRRIRLPAISHQGKCRL